jgi:hypothetical protein
MGALRVLWCTVLLLGLTVAQADWRDDHGLPDWARRGYCEWGHGANVNGRIKWANGGGFGVDMPNINLILYCGRNLMQTISYVDEEARRLGEGAGVKRQPYICSKTIWWRSEFPKAPQLEKCTIVKPDGTRVLLYNNPERYGGCYSSPIWLDYVEQRVDRLMADQKVGQVHSIFFDNASNYDCYCADCQAGFRAWSKERYGQEMDLRDCPQTPDGRAVKALFDAEVAVRFFCELREYIQGKYGREILISPNIGIGYGWSGYLVNHKATDLVMIEAGFTFPPTDSTVLYYKLGLAASHGKTTGQLLGLSQTLRRVRALALDQNNELGILESFMYPEEHKLALAEAMATGGTCQVSFALREQKITANNEPYQVQNREAIHQYAEFHQRHLGLFDRAQPSAQVAVVYALTTELCLRSTHRALAEATAALQRAGVPYEVLVEEDLTAEQLAGYKLLVMPEVRLLNRERCAAVEGWLGQGGALVQVGALAQRDELGRLYAPERMPALGKLVPGEARKVGRGTAWRPEEGLAEAKGAEVLAQLQRMAGPLEHISRVGASVPDARLFCNLLQSRDGKTRMAHLVNSDVTYDRQPTGDVQDDDGTSEARTYLADTRSRVRKVLLTPEPEKLAGMSLKFFGVTCGIASDAFSLVVSLNGQDIKTFKGSELNEAGWFQAPIPAGLLKPENEIIFRAEGKPSGHPDWVAIRLDTNATTRRTWWSHDNGQSWTQEDISLDAGAQQGEALVRIGPAEDPEKVARPEDFMGKLHVHPARNVEVCLQSGARPATATFATPEGVSVRVAPTVREGLAVYRVPEVVLYGMLTLGR